MLDVPEQDVVSMNRRLAAPDHSLNAPVRTDSEGEWQDWLVDETESQETAIAEREELTGRKALLSGALKTLNERERHILIERRLKDNPTTLEELSQQYGISRERVRQIEVRAFEKLQKAMKAQIAERRLARPADGPQRRAALSGSGRGSLSALRPRRVSSGCREPPFLRAKRPQCSRRGVGVTARPLPAPAGPAAARARASSHPPPAAAQASATVRVACQDAAASIVWPAFHSASNGNTVALSPNSSMVRAGGSPPAPGPASARAAQAQQQDAEQQGGRRGESRQHPA